MSTGIDAPLAADSAVDMTTVTVSTKERRELQEFLVRLGAAMNAADEPVYAVQQALRRVAAGYGMRDVRISAFPDLLLVSLAGGKSATLELTTPLASGPRGRS